MTTKIPTHTSTNAAKLYGVKACCPSRRSSADRSTPNTGFKKPYTATRPTGLYRVRALQMVWATADSSTMYPNSRRDCPVKCGSVPPQHSPVSSKSPPPTMN